MMLRVCVKVTSSIINSPSIIGEQVSPLLRFIIVWNARVLTHRKVSVSYTSSNNENGYGKNAYGATVHLQIFGYVPL